MGVPYTIGFNTIAKSGSGLIMNIILKILTENKSHLRKKQSIKNNFWSGAKDVRKGFRLLCSHFFGPQNLFDTNYNFAKNNPDIKFFCTVREPKDVITSAYNWIKNTNYNQQNINSFFPSMNSKQYIELSEEEKILKLIESENIRCQYKRSITFSKLENVKIYRFEDLTNNDKLINIIIDIYQHLGIKSFDTKIIEKDILDGLYFGDKLVEKDILNSKTFFKGKKGCYKEYFSQDCIDKFKEFYRGEEESLKVYNYIIYVETVETSVPENTGITLALLVNVKNLLDVAINRGVYKPEELTPVGKVYDMYSKCLESLKSE